ncbi:vomeronasal type-2 receptor 26-like [Rana temporaria]|uniref:vomeronasal type-2 receptor 26-like n=1 Tax=Rana temporaria TaxID=8407 RepID=UPI001AADDC24|nr:vomeronasal type-2 receptor 26-like [Rana temporaria]
MDKSDPASPILRRPPTGSSKVARLLHLYDLIDAWRECNPTVRDYTHFSQVHHTYSRIDHILVRTPLLPYMTSVRILSTPWSDHSPIKLSVKGLWSKPGPSSWRLNPSLLNDPLLYTEIEKELQEYFRNNKASDTSPTINWGAHKVTVWCKLIQLAVREKRNREQTVRQLEAYLDHLLDEQRRNPQPDIRRKIDDARLALNLSLTTQAEKHISWSKHKFYTMGDKPTTMLATKDQAGFVPNRQASDQTRRIINLISAIQSDWDDFLFLDKGSCHKCSEEEWPNDNNQCVPKPIEFLSYGNDPVPLAVSVISVFLFVKTCAIFYVFIKFRETPVVRANNQNLSFILLISIMLSFLCVFLFLGRPGPISCMFRQTSLGIIFSVALSSILAKTIMVYMAFKATKPGSFWRKYIGVKIPNCLIVLCSFIQVLISIIWLLTACPFPQTNTHLYADTIIIQCNEGSTLAFSILLGYIGLLAAVSFFVAFLARNLPDSFNETKYITFSMLVFCSVWIAFIPAYMSVTGKNTVLVEIFAIITSSLGILGCIFIPKCYIILVRPDLNSKSKLLIQTKTWQ